ncbi:MAG: hypothetical protein ACUVQG_00235 [Thermogutta sp.]
MKRLSGLLLILAMLVCQIPKALAGPDSESGSSTILERIDRLGEKVFSGLIPGRRKSEPPAARTPASDSRARSAFTGNSDSAPLKPKPDPAIQNVNASQEALPSPGAGHSPATALAQTPTLANPTSPRSAGNKVPIPKIPETATQSVSSESPPQAGASTPLYMRLLEYRGSPFSQPVEKGNQSEQPPAKYKEVEVMDKPPESPPSAGRSLPSVPIQRDSANSPQNPSMQLAERRLAPPPVQEPTPASKAETTVPTPAISRNLPSAAREPTLAVKQPFTPAGSAQVTAGMPADANAGVASPSGVSSQQPRVAAVMPTVGSSNLRTDGTTSSTSGATKDTKAAAPQAAGPSYPANVTWSGKMAEMATPSREKAIAGPVISVETRGPREITLGKPGLYEVIVRNLGRDTGNQVRVTIVLPAWAEIVEQIPGSGTVDVAKDGSAQNVVWLIEQIAPQKDERLRLKLIPRESKPIGLAVQYTLLAPVNETQIDVKEPKLAVRVDGPSQVLFGRAELYRLEIANTGTGEADNVVLSLLPLGTGQKTPATQNLGSILAGEKRVVEVELLPRQTGDLRIQMEVTADGGIRSQLEHVVTVLRPALEVIVEGPALQFLNENDRYQVVVRNPGTAAAENVRIQVSCPESVEPDLTALKGGKAVGDVLEWLIPSLPAGKEEVIQIPCRFVGMGDARLVVQATAEGNLMAQGEYLTQIQAVADLALRVEDPPRPVPVGKDGLYQIIIKNRGSKAATDVHVVGFFSEGIEPVAAQGVPHKIVPGQVVFEPISKIAPGETITLEIQARAQKAGNHVFRAELRCPSSDIRLAAEETTSYYDTTLAERPSSPVSNSSLR